MIENEGIAQQVSELMLEYGARLDKSVALIKEHCSEQELQIYRRAVGTIMTDMLLQVMNPIYARHPGLKPKELK
jgi:hypothetical protein